MPSRDNLLQSDPVTVKAAWLLIAVAINALELFIPRLPFLPWLKPGLANSITIIWLVRFGMRDALLYTMIRVWISGFYFGFSLLTMTLALSGGIFSAVVMGLAWQLVGKRNMLGTMGMGVIGAVAHNLAQLGVVYLLMSNNVQLFYQLPFMLTASMISGSIVGLLAILLWHFLDAGNLEDHSFPSAKTVSPKAIRHRDIVGTILVISFCFSLVFISNLLFLGFAALVITLTVQIIERGAWQALIQPFRFWLFFVFIGGMYLFFSYGMRIHGLPFVTYEGLELTAQQWLRLWSWLQVVGILRVLRFDMLFFELLRRLFPSHQTTLCAGLLALEHFPTILQFAKSNKTDSSVRFFRHPIAFVKSFISRTFDHITEILTDEEN